MAQCEAKVNDALQCTLEGGHSGMHMADFDLPPDLAMVVGGSIEELESLSIAYEEARRTMVKARNLLYFGAGVNIVCAIWNVVAILT